ncbi:aldehyde dehydrogenase family protein [Rhodococcus sp. WS1]|uniref:aldehyde dehydrogenase family protein n=1 Tax=unclassified Rhodococcus (in: high G+C Gram-positive bacteria) TaxID=192944 RepID=UPI001144DC25|nr:MULTISPECIES: aldehyde dehydrogenase family protein [unclassified Rhodococcus (in: high G+C Gram-positive bacteria)]ROZ52937.1 aldehyde dehydrogenase family protein [Rhodococcus sp. WS1]TQC36027.1 aldehyde dehydrogenase family protein [Rhodococcus sp. WS7]
MSVTSNSLALTGFLDNRSKQMLIDGRWQPAMSSAEFETVNPATGEVIARLASGQREDVDLAVLAARRAFNSDWSRWTPHSRRQLLLRIHDLIMANFDELALLTTLDMGAPLARTTALKDVVSQVIQLYASQTAVASTETLQSSIAGQFNAVLKAPVGVVGGVIPWNGPLVSQWWILGPTLATGCTAVLKPAEDASLAVLRVAELLVEAGVPSGVVNVVTGYGTTAGAALAEHPDVDRISFTGSTETGRKIVQASASNMKRVQLELGGKSPDIIFADADLDKAVPGAAMGVYANSGQVCIAGTRVLVQRSIYDEFVKRLADFSRTLTVGNGLDDVDLGPLVSKKQLDRVMRYIDIGQCEGARLVCGGKKVVAEAENGFFVEPTVFADVKNNMKIAQEEIFGPVIAVIPFEDEDEAIRLANDTDFGLAGGVWTKNLSTAHRMVQSIKAGTVWVNCYGAWDANVGFGGYKMSGYGWKGGAQHVQSFLYEKALYMNVE